MTRSPRQSRLGAMARRVAHSDDSGVSLVIALIFVTVVAVVIAAVLSFVDTSMRGTIAVRAEAAQAAAADGAAQIAINNIRNSTYSVTGGACTPFSGNSATLSLANFYPSTQGSNYSASVTCTVDGNDSASGGGGVPINSSNKPGNAILSLGTSASEDGVYFKANGNRNIIVHGNIFSNSNINVNLGTLTTNATVIARTTCTGTITASSKTCSFGNGANSAGNDPNYAAPPAAPSTAQTVPTCNGTKFLTFNPGLYNNLTALNNLTNGGCNATFWFKPGLYYFNFSGQWILGSGYVVGGTPMPGEVADGKVPDMPGSCETPIPPDPVPPGGWINPGPGAGVEFVFGADSQLYLNKGAMELCGSYSTTSPPIAIYGLKAASGSVPAENGCITSIPWTSHSGCALITSDNSPRSQLFIQGTTYVPAAAVDINLNNATGQVFRYGIIARHVGVTATGSADLSGPVIEVPDDTSGGGATRTVVYLAVYACPGTTACSTSGNPQLKVKIGIIDPTGTAVSGARQITVYDWSVQR